MKKNILLVLVAFLLSSCAILRTHKQDIQQGNVYTPAEINQLHKGMSTGDVVNLLGNPVDNQLFSNNRMAYVYSFKKGYSDMKVTTVTLVFVNGRLSEIVQ